jgi:hypothetical protein
VNTQNPTDPSDQLVINLLDMRNARASAVWRVKLIIAARAAIANAVIIGDHSEALALLQNIADDCYARGITDHQATVLDAISRGELL